MRDRRGPAAFARRWAESAWLFRGLTENLDQCVYVLDRDGRCLDVNDGFCRWLKKPRLEILDHFVHEFWPHPAAEHERVLCGEWIETEEDRPRGRHTVRVRLRKAPLRDAEGNVQGVLCLFREVAAEPAGTAPRRQASQLEMLGRMTRGVLHDLRNLLTLLIGPLELLRASLPPELGASDLATMDHAIKHATAWTERLLRTARGDPGELRLIDVNERCVEVVHLLRHNISPKIRLETRFRPGLPPIPAEAGEMMQVLLNLCLNACDAMPQGGELLVETDLRHLDSGETDGSSARRAGEFVCLQVRDNGEGMSPEVRAHIFEPLFTTKPSGRNSGLGLAIVQEIVQRRRGWIECESAPGAGTCFTVWLPTTSPDPRSIAAPSPQPRAPKTILIVEPDASVLLLASIVLAQQGFRVLSSEDGWQAGERYRQEQEAIDLVVIEENLPGRSGLEVANELLALNPRLPIVLVSAAGTPAASWPASMSSLILLNKPYTPEQLVQSVRNALFRG